MTIIDNISLLGHAAQGFITGAGLIVAIGAQNVFVLTQGARRNHHLLTAGICSLCDAALIALGVAGLGGLIAASPALRSVAGWGGAIFLSWYAFRSFCSAVQGGEGLIVGCAGPGSRRATILFTLGVTLLNPHVYIDTVVLLGGVGAQFPDQGRYAFGLGAMLASVVWFFGLSLGGRLLAPVLSRPAVWRAFHGIVGAFMLAVAAGLVGQAVAAGP